MRGDSRWVAEMPRNKKIHLKYFVAYKRIELFKNPELLAAQYRVLCWQSSSLYADCLTYLA